MDKRSEEMMEYLSEGMDHLDVSGFELLELLDLRSKLASREPLLSNKGKSRLEKLDQRLMNMADFWLERISEVSDLKDMRQRAHILPSHWWWYLDEITKGKKKIAV
ncbi:MAG: hypothetical protein K9N10_16720 [Deltaproteobacteria bacterium]|nr:hypothetical protein [Deltaproteobacteria bacterium]